MRGEVAGLTQHSFVRLSLGIKGLHQSLEINARSVHALTVG